MKHLSKHFVGFRINMTQLEQIGTGSIYTTVEDFFKWDQNFYDNKLDQGQQSLIEMMETPGTLKNGDTVEYGFELDVGTFFGLKLISHGGSFVGFRSYYMRFPDQRFSVVILSNQGPFPDYEIASDIAILYLKDLFTEPLDKKKHTVTEKNGQALNLFRLAQNYSMSIRASITARSSVPGTRFIEKPIT
jgi:hypothetical protein